MRCEPRLRSRGGVARCNRARSGSSDRFATGDLMKPIGVRMLVGNYPPHGGGAERQCALLAHRLHQLGDRVAVLTRRLPDLATSNGIAVPRLGSPTGPRALRGASFSLAALGQLLRERADYDVIHCHG